ncbi:hypothetical protein CEJ63_24180, partial [Acinetobacter baumannii]
MRCSRLLLPALGLALLTACQGRSPEPGSAPAKDDAASVDKAAGDGKLRWSEAVVWDGDLNACRQADSAATRDCLRDAMRAGGASA